MFNKFLYLLIFCVIFNFGYTSAKTEDPVTNQPKFISKGAQIKANKGDDIELQCLVDNLGEYYTFWKYNRSQLLFVHNLRIHRDDRISRNENNDLLIRQFRMEDSGEYSCVLSTDPPQAIYYQVDLGILCERQIQEFTAESGTITSYNYPNQYPDNINCQFRISVESDRIIIVNFETFSIPFDHGVLKIYDVQNTSNVLIDSYGGDEIIPKIVSTFNSLYFNLSIDNNSNNNNKGKGFVLKYKSIEKNSLVNLTENEGIIQSPDYPNNYPHGINYTWKLLAPSDNLIELEFNHFETEEIHDILEIIEVSNNKQMIIAELSGSVEPDIIVSNTNEMILKFTTDYEIDGKGFEISYKFLKANKRSNSLETQNSSILCDNRTQEFTSKSGIITSFNYPDNYTDNLNCQFRIFVDNNEIIVVKFETLRIASGDILNIYDDSYSSYRRIYVDIATSRIVSSSNYLYFEFITNNNYTSNGFKLNYKSIKKVSVVNLTESRGIIRSPEYPYNYPKDIDYTWKISAPDNYVIILGFYYFDTESFEDILQIIEVSKNTNTSLGNYSGFKKPERLITNTNQLILRFKTDSGYERKGFEIYYKFAKAGINMLNRPTSITTLNSSILCDENIQEFTWESGSITSYNYPNEYPDNLNCMFRISVESEKIIIVDFETFSTEFAHDILKIYDGINSTSTLIIANSGNDSLPRIVSATNYLYFNFITDDTDREKGFKLNYKTAKKVSVVNLTDSEGIIQSPEYPNNYTRGIIYTWNILAPTDKLIMLDFNFFETETSYDVLEILGVFMNKNISFGNFSGSVYPERFLSNTNELIAKFKTDLSNQRNGFEIFYKFVKAEDYWINRSLSLTNQNYSLLCDGRIEEFSDKNGSITSPNYTDQYPNNQNCQFRISAESDEIIILYFDTFLTKFNRDFLKIYDGFSLISRNIIIISYSGEEILPRIESIKNYLYFNLITDSNHPENRFKLNYKSIKKISMVTITDSGGVIQSPEYPNNYISGLSYTWKIIAPPNQSIVLEFNYFDTQPTHDVLEIIEVSDNTNTNTTLAYFSGSFKTNRLSSKTNELVLKFRSSVTVQRKGFEISYKFVDRSSLTTQNISILCNGRTQDFKSEAGTIISYNYPNNYANNLNCQFRIIANFDQIIIVNFETFATEAPHDILKIYDSSYSSYVQYISSYSGPKIPPRIVSTSNYLYFNFTTDSSKTENGFKFNYKTIKKISSVNLTQSEGIIQSPEYPNNYTRGLSYTWKISAPSDSLIQLEINDFDTEPNHDILKIIGVVDNKNKSLANYTGSVKPESLLSYANQIILKFTSDSSVERKGFEISYKFLKTGSDPKFLIQTPHSLVSAGYNESVLPHIYQSYNNQFDIEHWSDEEYFAYWELFHQYSNNFEMSMLTLSIDKTDAQSINFISFYNSHSKHLHIISNNSVNILEESVGAIAYDSNNNLLIWTDIQNSLIKIIKINETKTEYTFNNPIKSITNQMVINREKSVLIWTVLGHNPRIIETNFDGSNQSIIYNNSRQVSHLTADYEIQRYYFIDIKTYSLYSIDFNGENETFYMRSEELFNINNFFVWNNNIYLSNSQLVYKISNLDLKIMKAEILYCSYDYYKMERDFKIENELFFKRNTHLILRNDFQSIIPLEYKISTNNKCSFNQCSHLCLPMVNGFRCVCPSNYWLVNETKCLEIKADSSVQTSLQLDDLKLNSKILHFLNESLYNQFGSVDLVENFNNFKLELDKLKLESSSNSNISKFSITNFILIILLITFNVLTLYYVHKRSKSIDKLNDKRRESKIPLIVLNKDSQNDGINDHNQNSMDNEVFSNC